MIIQVDSREKKNQEVLDYFDKVGQKYFISKLYTGDYCDANSVKIIIDLKKDLLELCGNLTKKHDIFRNEIERALSLDCKFIVLIREPFENLEAIKSWECPKNKNGKKRSNLSGEILYKIMKTMHEKYNIEWLFCTRENAGNKIIKILEEVV